MSYPSLLRCSLAAVLVAALGACTNRAEPPAHSTPGKDENADTKQSGGQPNRNVPMGQLMAEARREATKPVPPGHSQMPHTMPAGHPPVGTTLPAGHPPIGGMPPSGMGMATNLPAGHPPIGSADGVQFQPQKPEHMLTLKPAATWTPQKLRASTVALYALPKAAGDPEDAELAISHFPEMKGVPLQMQVKGWADQFEHSATNPAGEAIKQYELEKAPHPTAIVDISGRYRGRMGRTVGLKDNYRMIVAEVETDDGPWFFKLVGPQATVAEHADEFLKFVREAK